MNKEDPEIKRLELILQLVAREDRHLLGVRDRFMPAPEQLDVATLEAALQEDIGVDRLESFGAKFGRMQDTVIDKLLPQLLKAAGETPMAAIDNLNRAERLGFVSSADSWLEMRRLRNRLVHEYIDSLEEMVPALKKAHEFTIELHNAYAAMAQYAETHLGVKIREEGEWGNEKGE